MHAMDQEHNRAPALAADTEEERQEAMRRFAVLRPHLNDGVPLPEAARDAGVPLRSVQRWLARYRATGLSGLVRATRSDTGHRMLPAALVEVIEGMALRKPRPSVAAIHRRIGELATQRQWTPPSYSCSGPQSSGGWPTNKGTRRPTFAANMRDVGPTIAANETTLFANSSQTSL